MIYSFFFSAQFSGLFLLTLLTALRTNTWPLHFLILVKPEKNLLSSTCTCTYCKIILLFERRLPTFDHFAKACSMCVLKRLIQEKSSSMLKFPSPTQVWTEYKFIFHFFSFFVLSSSFVCTVSSHVDGALSER